MPTEGKGGTEEGEAALCLPLAVADGTARAQKRVPAPAPAVARPGLTRDAVVLRRGAGQAARQVRGELGGVAVTARHPQRPRRAHPVRRPAASRPPRPGCGKSLEEEAHRGDSLRELRSPGRPGGSEGADALNPRF